MRRAGFVMLTTLALAACGAGSNWTRPGATYAEAEADWAQCRNAQPRPGGGVVGNNAGHRGLGGASAGVASASSPDQIQAARTCMQERGWQPARG
jgi:hypothetical protein